MTDLHLFAASGVELRNQSIQRARKRLKNWGFSVMLDASARARHQRFAGADAVRLETLYRIADAAPSVALACRGGYGLTRLLDALDWQRIARSVDRGTRWVGYSDMTALQLGLLAHTGRTSWHGPMAADDFGWEPTDSPDATALEQVEMREITAECFVQALSGELEAVGFKTESGFDGLDVNGVLWGGNLAMVSSLLGTPHWPHIKNGILFLEDVNEHPYRIERALLQLAQAGILQNQKAVLLGQFTDWRPSPLDRGYNFKHAVAAVRQAVKVPILTGFPFGHVPLKLTIPIGMDVQLVVQGRDVLVGWEHNA